MTKRFKGKTCIVTGGSAGIGLATVRRFLDEGAEVLFCGTNIEAGEKALKLLDSPKAHFMRADVGEEQDIKALIEHAIASMGHIDILVNNAAKAAVDLIPDHSTADWRRSMAVNIDSVFFTCREVIPHMAKRGGGSIINVASISGLAGDGAYPSY